MLMPKRVKYRKSHRGRRRGKAYRGSTINFGDFAIKATEAGWITSRQIEACRIAITRNPMTHLNKHAKLNLIHNA